MSGFTMREVAIWIEANEKKDLGLHDFNSIGELKKAISKCILEISINEANYRILSLNHEPHTLRAMNFNIMCY